MKGVVQEIEAEVHQPDDTGAVHQTRQDAEQDHEHFGGKTTEQATPAS